MINYLRKLKILDSPTSQQFDLHGALIHNPYVGSYHRGRISNENSYRHNPYVGTIRHSPKSNSIGLKSLIYDNETMPFITQIQELKDRKLKCVNLCRESLKILPIIRYSHEDSTPQANIICAVCLESYKDKEYLRILPNCSHSFHKKCIDTWLIGSMASQDSITSYCPTCRKDASFDFQNSSNNFNLEISSEAFHNIGSLLMNESIYNSIDANIEENIQEPGDENDVIPCLALNSSDYSTCGYPIFD